VPLLAAEHLCQMISDPSAPQFLRRLEAAFLSTGRLAGVAHIPHDAVEEYRTQT
jgi:hypothetical protein